jgi:hypothetical protein
MLIFCLEMKKVAGCKSEIYGNQKQTRIIQTTYVVLLQERKQRMLTSNTSTQQESVAATP